MSGEYERMVDGTHGVQPQSAVLRGRVRAALRRLAAALDDDEIDLDDLREQLEELVDQLDASEVVAAIDRGGARRQRGAAPTECFTAASVARLGGEPVDAFLLIPFGRVEVERPTAGESFEFTPEHAAAAVAWFGRIGRRLAIDYEHQTFDRLNTRPDGLRPAAGWIGGLEVRADGLWATDVKWTARAQELLRSGEYCYFSPVIFWKDADHGELAGLGPVALTNDPAMVGVEPLAARRRDAEGDPGRASDEASDDEVEVDAARDDALRSPLLLRARLTAAEQEVAHLRRKLLAQEADAFVESGLLSGKMTDATSMDWRGDFLRDPRAARERLSRAPVVLPPGRVVRSARTAAGPESGGSGTAMLRRLGIEPEDLEAYEQAAAAGRIRVG
ncbi:MAG: phage protease [Phycisphaerae bacterium]